MPSETYRIKIIAILKHFMGVLVLCIYQWIYVAVGCPPTERMVFWSAPFSFKNVMVACALE